MSISSAIVNSWVLIAATPYIAIAGYDFWLHETDRQVPKVERAFHALVITSVAAFLLLAATANNRLAAAVLVVLLVAATVDEVRFHGELERHEKRLHFYGGAALAFCVGVWLWTI